MTKKVNNETCSEPVGVRNKEKVFAIKLVLINRSCIGREHSTQGTYLETSGPGAIISQVAWYNVEIWELGKGGGRQD